MQVTLVNDNMQEFYVRFHGPDESASTWASAYLTAQLLSRAGASPHTPLELTAQTLEDPRRAAESVPVQVAVDRLHEQDLPPEHRRALGLRLSGRDQSDVVADGAPPTGKPSLTAQYDMVNIFEVFLPQLLRYPNPSDPLNGEAAALLMREPKQYDARVRGPFLSNLTELTAQTTSSDLRRRTRSAVTRTKRTRMRMR